MVARSNIECLLLEGRGLHEVERDILSVLPAAVAPRRYDAWARAAFYDSVVASRLYNRVVWGTTPDDYAAFEERALTSRGSGWMLDAGCGSLVFTTDVFANHHARPVVLLDHSLRMLRRARRRLEQRCGRVPDHLVLVHADLFDLPFLDAMFTTVSFPAVVHAFDDPAEPIGHLQRVLATDGALFMTSLVRVPGRAFANRYLHEMYRGGEIAAPRSADELARHVEAAGGLADLRHFTIGNMAFFTNDGC